MVGPPRGPGGLPLPPGTWGKATRRGGGAPSSSAPAASPIFRRAA